MLEDLALLFLFWANVLAVVVLYRYQRKEIISPSQDSNMAHDSTDDSTTQQRDKADCASDLPQHPKNTAMEFSPPRRHRPPPKKGKKKALHPRCTASTQPTRGTIFLPATAPMTAGSCALADSGGKQDSENDQEEPEEEAPSATGDPDTLASSGAASFGSMADRPPIRTISPGVEIVPVCPDLVAARKFLSIKRWLCISRPQVTQPTRVLLVGARG